MTRIAVTGASGFVARHLIPLALREGNDVRGLARRAPDGTGSAGTAGGFHFVTGDVRNEGAVQALIEGSEAVIHLAPGFTPEEGLETVVLEGTRNVLAAAKDAGVGRLVYLSCLGADGSAESPYMEAKWKAEQLVRSSEVPFTILRSSLIVGNGDGVTDSLARLAQTLPAVPVPGSGMARQQPIDVQDLARCLLAALTQETLLNDTFPVGGPMFITIRQLADLVQARLGLAKPKVLMPPAILPLLRGLLPGATRDLYAPPRLAQLRSGVVASPGIVESLFGFRPVSVLDRLSDYLV